MAKMSYDIIIVGGGMGGAVLAKVMAEYGVRVLVLEREKQFKDRVRGEGMHAWGVPEARALGVYDLLRETCGVEVRWWDTYIGATLFDRRDFVATTPHHSPLFAFYHPEMQEALLTAAADAGAEVRRDAHVHAVQPGALPRVSVEQDGWRTDVQARLVVGADGRSSLTRQWAGFEVQRDPERRLFAGVLLENVPVASDAWVEVLQPDLGQVVFLCSVGRNRVRAYFGYPKEAHRRFQGAGDLSRFVTESLHTGASPDFFADARAIGPLATFAADDTWVEHPYKSGVALLGDAAATCDPTFGQGLALTLRSVRLLWQQLCRHEDWNVAGQGYAAEHARDYQAIHTLEDWLRTVLLETGPEAESRRARAFPLLAEDGTRFPDLSGLGPDAPTSERVRRRFFGEE